MLYLALHLILLPIFEIDVLSSKVKNDVPWIYFNFF